MSRECTNVSVKTEGERKTLRIALTVNVTMFVIGTVVGLWAQSTGFWPTRWTC